MRLVRTFEEFDDRSLTADEIKEALARTHASFEEYVSLGEVDQARAAYKARDNLLLALAARLKEDEVA
jgi:hypothetical protein